MELPGKEALLELEDWANMTSIAKSCGFRPYRLKRNITGVRSMKINPELKQSNVLYYVPDVIDFLEARIERI